MTTQTDLANAALAYIGSQKIADIDDTTSVPARACKRFIDDTIKEELTTNRWKCATKRQVLSKVAPTPSDLGDFYSAAYQLPADCLRVMEVNGEPWETAQQYFSIEVNGRMLSSWGEANILYVANIEVHQMHPLLADAIALKLASKVALQLSASNDLQGQMLTFYNRQVSKARQIDALERSQRATSNYWRNMGESPLVNSRYRYGGPDIYQFGRYWVPWV